MSVPTKWYFVRDDKEIQATVGGTLVAILELSTYGGYTWLRRVFTSNSFGLTLYYGRVDKVGEDYETL